MYCRYCGAKLDGGKFCGDCGRPVIEDQDKDDRVFVREQEYEYQSNKTKETKKNDQNLEFDNNKSYYSNFSRSINSRKYLQSDKLRQRESFAKSYDNWDSFFWVAGLVVIIVAFGILASVLSSHNTANLDTDSVENNKSVVHENAVIEEKNEVDVVEELIDESINEDNLVLMESEVRILHSSADYEFENYELAKKDFEDNGFTNIKTNAIYDLILGILVLDGEIEDININGKNSFTKGDVFDKNAEIIITYHTYVSEDPEYANTINESSESSVEDTDEVLTIENCKELEAVLLTKSSFDYSYIDFAQKYKDSTIKFDGSIDYVTYHGDYSTRYDILITAGDYNEDHVLGPTFKFEDVAAYNLDISSLFLEDEIYVGRNVVITAIVVEYEESTELFFLKPISVTFQ